MNKQHKKVYCQYCRFYKKAENFWEEICEPLGLVESTYYTPIQQQRLIPRIINKKNECQFFEGVSE